MVEVICPHCDNKQNSQHTDVGAEQCAKEFSWHNAKMACCEQCGKLFVEDNNLIAREE